MHCTVKHDLVRECINNSFQVEGKILFSSVEGDGYNGKRILIARLLISHRDLTLLKGCV